MRICESRFSTLDWTRVAALRYRLRSWKGSDFSDAANGNFIPFLNGKTCLASSYTRLRCGSKGGQGIHGMSGLTVGELLSRPFPHSAKAARLQRLKKRLRVAYSSCSPIILHPSTFCPPCKKSIRTAFRYAKSTVPRFKPSPV